MKPLPYRARRVDTNELVYGSLIAKDAYDLNDGTHKPQPEKMWIREQHVTWNSNPNYKCWMCYEYEVHPSTVSQSTGEVDVNKQEIFGGMWLKASIYGDETPQELQVVWRGTAFVIDYKDSESECVILSEFVGSVEIIPEGDKT